MAVKRVNLARTRKAAGYTQEALAYALGVDPSTVVRWERGQAEPLPYKRLKDLREALTPYRSSPAAAEFLADCGGVLEPLAVSQPSSAWPV